MLLLLLLLGAGICQSAWAEEPEGQKNSPVIVPRVGIGIEYGGLLVSRGDFSSALRYRFLIDLLQVGRHLIYTDFDGEIDWGTPESSLTFNRTRHYITIVGYRYDLGNYYVGGQFFHFCNNPFRGPYRPVKTQHDQVVYRALHDRTAAGAYFAGVELVDKAMLVAQENRGIVFDMDKPCEFLGRFHVAINLYRAISQQDNNLDWLFKGSVRLDVLRFYNLVPYVQAGGDVLGQGHWNFIPKVETGVRMHWRNFEFTPFVQWGHTEEWLRIYQNAVDGPYIPKTIHFESRSYLYAGGRLEFLLDRESIATRDTGATWQVFPEVHGQGDYGLYLGSRYNSSNGGFNLNLDLVRWQKLSLFAYLGMHAESTPDTFGPENVLYSVDYGLRYDWPQVFLEGFARNAARVHVTGGYGAESPNQAGMRVGTQGIRLGHYDDGISFDQSVPCQWLNKFNAQVGLGHYFNTARWPANWNLATEGRWDIFRARRKILYVQGGLDWLTATQGSTDVVNYYVEPGLRFHGVMDLAFYYRFQHKENVIVFRGPTENQSLVGIRAIF